ncbi:hypothetical protein Gogos_002110, partial [Gossypium gossypioides]|nr:hypothetical protein [Gossypium gossypioides]
DWLVFNLQGHQDWCVGAEDWQCLFGIIAWCFWKNRNLFIFYRITWSANETIKACLNIDRSVRNEVNFSMAGGIAKNSDGVWILGFNRFLGNCSSFYAKLKTKGSSSTLIRRIHQMLLRFDQWNVRHISREDNQDVDRMVKLTHYNSYDLCLYETSPLGEMF